MAGVNPDSLEHHAFHYRHFLARHIDDVCATSGLHLYRRNRRILGIDGIFPVVELVERKAVHASGFANRRRLVRSLELG